MTRRAALAALVALAAAAPLVLPEAAPARNVVQCAPDNAWCTAVVTKRVARPGLFLDLAGFELRGRYRLCVTPPGRRERCRVFGLRPNETGAHASSVRLAANWPSRVRGRYRARWLYEGRQLGRTLAFTAGGTR